VSYLAEFILTLPYFYKLFISCKFFVSVSMFLFNTFYKGDFIFIVTCDLCNKYDNLMVMQNTGIQSVYYVFIYNVDFSVEEFVGGMVQSLRVVS
jgi:hypothetical protein